MTLSSLQNFRVTRDPRGVLVASLDVAGRAHNVFNEEVIFELQSLIDEVEHDATIRLVLFRSGKESGFLTGGDLREIAAIGRRQTADQILTIGQKLFARLERLPVPTVAVIHGPCLGGGLEFALACHYRLARDDRQTRLGLPEVELGLLPGWGGTQRLPQRVGLWAALPIILSGRKLSAREALARGLVDGIWPPDRLESGVEQFVSARLEGKPLRRPVRWFARLRDRTRWGQWLALRAARRQIAERGRHYPALPAALGAVELGLRQGREAGLAREREAFAELLFTPTCRNLMGLFFQREQARKPSTWIGALAGKTRPIQRVAVVGAGVMGAGIAQLAAVSGLEVVLKDVDERALALGMRRIEQLMAKAQRKELLSSADARARYAAITTCTHWEGVTTVDLAIEAVPENEHIKQAVFRELDRRLPHDCLIVSNTSALSIERLAGVTARPDLVAGLHFFNPVHQMQLVEIVRHGQTSDATAAVLIELVRALGKVPLVVADAPGFLVNRVLFPYLDEAVRLVWEGAAPEAVDRCARDFGMLMGPLEVLDRVGIDVAADVAVTLSRVTPEPSPTPGCLSAMLERGWTGMKSGRGFYHYRRGRRGQATRWDEQFYRRLETFTEMPLERTLPAGEPNSGQQRLTCALINEAARCLERHVVAEPWMVDLGMVLGAGFAPFYGGPLRLADHWSVERVVADLQMLEQRCGRRFAPCALLTEMRDQGARFYPERAEEAVGSAAEAHALEQVP